MKSIRLICQIAISSLWATLTLAALPVGTSPAPVSLSGDLGGRLDGKPWSSDELKGKVMVVLYVDPDEKAINEKVEDALKAEKFPYDRYGSVAVINMAASWIPNKFIASALEEKQKKFPNTIYVKDLKRSLVKSWQLKDDSYCIVAFDKDGKVIFSKDGKFADEDTKSLIEAIRKSLSA